MNFGQALEELKNGAMITRSGWHGIGTFLYYVPAGMHVPCTKITESLVNEDGLLEYDPYIAMRTGEGNIVPWIASHVDLLSSDWLIVNFKRF